MLVSVLHLDCGDWLDDFFTSFPYSFRYISRSQDILLCSTVWWHAQQREEMAWAHSSAVWMCLLRLDDCCPAGGTLTRGTFSRRTSRRTRKMLVMPLCSGSVACVKRDCWRWRSWLKTFRAPWYITWFFNIFPEVGWHFGCSLLPASEGCREIHLFSPFRSQKGEHWNSVVVNEDLGTNRSVCTCAYCGCLSAPK